MSFNAIRENKTLVNISRFTAYTCNIGLHLPRVTLIWLDKNMLITYTTFGGTTKSTSQTSTMRFCDGEVSCTPEYTLFNLSVCSTTCVFTAKSRKNKDAL